MLGITPSQTVGPFYAYCLTPAKYKLHENFTNNLIVQGIEGEKIRIEGRVLDGDNIGIPDAMVEIWQADTKGGFAHGRQHQGANTGFKGFGRVEPDHEGNYHFITIKPGRVKTRDGKLQAQHIDVAIFARGMLKHLVTRIYFGDEESNKDDPVLSQVPADRRDTLIAKPQSGNGGERVYRFDIRIQEGPEGPPETQFFEF
ncbi:MAG TPA: protocatechuate 3,4-dioxygenase subunit alpha [Xanthobacteraceae bacterium]|nr:protocatechuate 3,4-dioxygenase subunit alpha [Xanthobacteraceae bacterium]